MAKTKSRAKRWEEAAGELRKALDALQEAAANYEAALSDLRDVKSEFEDWRDNLPENLQGSALGEKLETVCDLDFDVEVDLSEYESLVDEAENADLPLGFGRD